MVFGQEIVTTAFLNRVILVRKNKTKQKLKWKKQTNKQKNLTTTWLPPQKEVLEPQTEG